MKRLASSFLTALLSVGLAASQAMAATVCGVAQNAQGAPLSGATIVVKNSSGQVLGTATTGSKGQYVIDNVANGTLDLFLNTGSPALKGGSGVLNLSGATQAVNWQVSNAANAIASQGGTCLDPPAAGALTGAEWAAIGVLGLGVAAGGATIGYFESENRPDSHQQPQQRHPITAGQ
jgi:hypothetical protein